MTRRQRGTPLLLKDSELLRRANTRAVCRTRVGKGIGFHEGVSRRAGQTRGHIIRLWRMRFGALWHLCWERFFSEDERGTPCSDMRVWAFSNGWELDRESIDCRGLRNGTPMLRWSISASFCLCGHVEWMAS